MGRARHDVRPLAPGEGLGRAAGACARGSCCRSRSSAGRKSSRFAESWRRFGPEPSACVDGARAGRFGATLDLGEVIHENNTQTLDRGVRRSGLASCRSPNGVGARWRRRCARTVSARDRTPRRRGLPARPHAGGVRTRDQARRRLHRTGPGGHEGRAPHRSSRAQHHRHDRRGEPSRVRRPRDDEGGRRCGRDRLLRVGLHAGRDQDIARRAAVARAAAAVQRQVRDPDAQRGHRPGETHVEAGRADDRRLSGDEAPDLPRRSRASARAPAGRTC